MSEKIGIKSLNGHPLIDEDARERIAALEESGGGGGSAGGGVVFRSWDGNTVECVYTAAEIKKMVTIGVHIPMFWLCTPAPEAPVLIHMPCIQVNQFVIPGQTMEVAGLEVLFKNSGSYITVDFNNNTIELEHSEE